MCRSEFVLVDEVGEEVLHTGHGPAPLGSLPCRVLLPANRTSVPERMSLLCQEYMNLRKEGSRLSGVMVLSRCVESMMNQEYMNLRKERS